MLPVSLCLSFHAFSVSVWVLLCPVSVCFFVCALCMTVRAPLHLTVCACLFHSMCLCMNAEVEVSAEEPF